MKVRSHSTLTRSADRGSIRKTSCQGVAREIFNIFLRKLLKNIFGKIKNMAIFGGFRVFRPNCELIYNWKFSTFKQIFKIEQLSIFFTNVWIKWQKSSIKTILSRMGRGSWAGHPEAWIAFGKTRAGPLPARVLLNISCLPYGWGISRVGERHVRSTRPQLASDKICSSLSSTLS